MSSDERDIFNYLQTWGDEFINPKEVCRRAGTKKRFYDDPEWARPIMSAMADRGILESDMSGRYRVKAEPKKGHNKRWVSPDIEKILNDNGVDIEGAGDSSAADDHFESL